MSALRSLFAPLGRREASRPMVDFLSALDNDIQALVDGRSGFLAQLTRYVLLESGKRVRPALVFLSSAFGASDPASVKKAALSVELIHIATLVHDDLVDEAAMRRNKPTVGVRFGEGAAVLLGDHVYAEAFRIAASLGDAEIVRVFADTSMLMCEGEIGQLEKRHVFDLSEEEYMTFLDRKTASLMAASCRVGARLGGLGEAQASALETFGRSIGLAFQIVDDILDLEGEEALTGKTLGTDIQKGKMTLPLIHALRSLPDAGRRASVVEHLRSPNGRTPDIIAMLKDMGSLEYSRRRAEELLAQAQSALDQLPDHPNRALLAEVARTLAERKL